MFFSSSFVFIVGRAFASYFATAFSRFAAIVSLITMPEAT
jgi:hypothetical protein